MASAATWMDLEIIIHMNKPDRKQQYIIYTWNLKKKKKKIQMNVFTNRNRFTDIENKFMLTKGV